MLLQLVVMAKQKKNSILETHKIMPISPYAKSKYKGEKFLKHYSKKKKN